MLPTLLARLGAAVSISRRRPDPARSPERGRLHLVRLSLGRWLCDVLVRPSTAFAQRIARVGASRRWRLWRLWAALGVLVLTVGLAGASLADRVRSHPYFAVTEILVTPTLHVRPGALLEWVGIESGMSIWSADPTTLAVRLMAHPWIRRASVRREFPRRLVLRVREREPAAILLLDHLYYVDRTGMVFARLGAHDSLDVPFVTGIEAAVLAGERPYPRRAVRQALKLLEFTRAAGLPFRVSEVHIERGEGITIFPVAPPVALGFGWGHFPAKLVRLARVLQAFAGRETQIREIDLSYETQAVVRLRVPEGGGRRKRA
jgi:hypothetical protein